jgi:hypothetical protein
VFLQQGFTTYSAHRRKRIDPSSFNLLGCELKLCLSRHSFSPWWPIMKTKSPEICTLHKRVADALKLMCSTAGSYPRLAKQLTTMLDRPVKIRVPHWRRLEKIASGTPVRVSFAELEAIHAALDQFKFPDGLASFFAPPRLLELLVSKGKVTLIVGTKPYLISSMSPITSASHWDLKSIAVLTEAIYRHAPPSVIAVQLSEILLRSPDYLDTFTKEDKSGIKPEDILATLRDRDDFKDISDAQSIISIGSPRANHATECMLAKMFNVPPFMPEEKGPRRPLPFQFEWSALQLQKLHSTFARRSSHKNGKVNEKDWRTAALWIGDTRYGIDRDQTVWTDYGVIAVQRRPRGGIWACCSGSGGPATFAAACKLGDLVGHLPPASRLSSKSSVLWTVVTTRVKRDSGTIGDDRKMTLPSLLDKEPYIWPYQCE